MGCGLSAPSPPAARKTQADARPVAEAAAEDGRTAAQRRAECRDERLMEPMVDIVDPHHHFFETGFPAAWLAAPAISNSFGKAEDTFVGAPYMLRQLICDIAENNVTHTVYVTGGAFWDTDDSVPKHLKCVGETRKCQALAEGAAACALPAVCAGIVAHADLSLGKELVAEQLVAHVAAGANLRGVRDNAACSGDGAIFNATSNANKLGSTEFREGLREVASRGLVFDTYVFPQQLAGVADLALAFPELTVVLNHAGQPLGVSTFAPLTWGNELAQQWRDGIARLAACPNVYIKLGGWGMPVTGLFDASASTPPSSRHVADVLAPWFGFVLDHVGADRCMFESNFPVDKASCSYTVLWNAFKHIARDRGLPAPAVARLFGGTAKAVYRL